MVVGKEIQVRKRIGAGIFLVLVGMKSSIAKVLGMHIDLNIWQQERAYST